MFERFHIVRAHSDAPRPTGPSGKLVLSSIRFGESRLAAGATSIKFVLEGEEEYEIDGRRYAVNPGQFLVVDVGQDCACRVRRKEVTLGMCVYLPPGAFEGLSHGRTLMLGARSEGLGQFMSTQAARLWHDPQSAAAAARSIIETAGRMANLAGRQAEARMARLGAVKPATRKDLLHRLERARAYLHDNPGRAVAQGQLARVAGLSQFHLARQFRDVFGQSPGAYHRQIRLQAARSFLDAGLTLDAAAERTGYSDGSALGHALRRARMD